MYGSFGFGLKSAGEQQQSKLLVHINQPHGATGDVFKFMDHPEQKLSLLKKRKTDIILLYFLQLSFTNLVTWFGFNMIDLLLTVGIII